MLDIFLSLPATRRQPPLALPAAPRAQMLTGTEDTESWRATPGHGVEKARAQHETPTVVSGQSSSCPLLSSGLKHWMHLCTSSRPRSSRPAGRRGRAAPRRPPVLTPTGSGAGEFYLPALRPGSSSPRSARPTALPPRGSSWLPPITNTRCPAPPRSASRAARPAPAAPATASRAGS